MALAVLASPPSDVELQRTLTALLSGVDWTTTTTGQVRALLSSKFNGVDLEHRKRLILQQACSRHRSRARAQLLTLAPPAAD
jgi:DEK C terminal domain